jgi:hypothetical protein
MQFAVVPPSAEPGRVATLSQADEAEVVDILKETAARLHLMDRTATSMVPGTLAFFQDTDRDDPIKLIAWKQDDRILIDFMHATEEGLGESLTYRDARDRLLQDLQAAFGPRLKIVPLGKQEAP